MVSRGVDTARFAGVPVVSGPPSEMLAWVLEHAQFPHPGGHHVHLLAGHSVVLAHDDAEFREVLSSSGFVIPDGRWLELLTTKSPKPLRQLRGQDLLREVCEQGQPIELGHYFFTSSEEVLASLQAKLRIRFPQITLRGGEAYPFGTVGEADRRDLVKRVVDSGAHVIWMGISSPRQDKEAYWLSEATGKTVICVGAALDFEAGAQKSAPRWVQRAGFEWLYRLLREPRRLLYRYTIGSLRFVALVLRHRRSVR